MYCEPDIFKYVEVPLIKSSPSSIFKDTSTQFGLFVVPALRTPVVINEPFSSAPVAYNFPS
jgi:hypothetical protein